MPEEGNDRGSPPEPDQTPARRPAGGTEVTESLRGAFSGMFGRDMQRNEQIAALVGSLAAVLTGIGLFVAVLVQHHHSKGQLPAGGFLGISGGFGVLLFLAARRGSRVVTSLVSMLGAMVAMPGVLRFPYLALAVWLLMRNSRAVREQRMAQGGGRPAGRAPASRAPRQRGADRRAASSRRASAKAAAQAEAARRAAPSKRYTPPGGRRRK